MRLLIAAALLAACGGKKEARHDAAPPAPADAALARPADAAPAAPSAVTVRVEWKDAPAAVRTSPGRDRCGAARPPYATVHTLHGVADVAVWLVSPSPVSDTKEQDTGVATPVIVRDCGVTPAVQVAGVGAPLRVTSLEEGRVEAEIRWGETVVARPALPVVGHAIEMALERPGTYAVATAKAAEPAWIVAVEGRGAVTDATGVATIADVPPGTYEVRAWLRGAAGQPPREAKGKVTVVAGQDAEVTLSIAQP